MNPIDQLKSEVEYKIKKLDSEILKTPFEDPEVYADFLAQTYYFVCHSTRLLALASSRFPMVMNDFHYRYAEHVKEEKGHEMMALRDLRNLEFEIRNFPEYSETKAFYQTQYYQIEHVGAVAFWGYVLCLECFAISGAVEIYRRTRKEFGDKATLFLKVHVKEDIGHVGEAYKALEGINSAQVGQIIANMKLSCDLYGGIYRRINQTAENKKVIEAA